MSTVSMLYYSRKPQVDHRNTCNLIILDLHLSNIQNEIFKIDISDCGNCSLVKIMMAVAWVDNRKYASTNTLKVTCVKRM